MGGGSTGLRSAPKSVLIRLSMGVKMKVAGTRTLLLAKGNPSRLGFLTNLQVIAPAVVENLHDQSMFATEPSCLLCP